MLDKNILTKFSHYIKLSESKVNLNEVDTICNAYEKVYSYQVLMCLSDEELSGFEVDIVVSQTDEYNTIDKDKMRIGITNSIIKSSEKTKILIGFEQPPLELLIKLYEPLINKLARTEAMHWDKLEFDDLYQMCRLSICDLYNQGYFIHKELIKITFIRAVLTELRLHGTEYDAIPMQNLNTEDREYIDYIEDESVEDEFKEIIDGGQVYIDSRKQTVIDIIGQRQYDQIVREYRTGTTSNSTRKLVNKLKNQLSEVK